MISGKGKMINIGDIADSLSQVASILHNYPKLLKDLDNLRSQIKLMKNLLALIELEKVYPHDLELSNTVAQYRERFRRKVLGQVPGYLFPPGYGLDEEEFLKIAERNLPEKSFALLREIAARKKKHLSEAFEEMASEEITTVDTPNARRKTGNGK